MKNSAAYAPLVCLPIVITAPGAYITRSGETVQLDRVFSKNDHGNVGHYPNGVQDKWHRSGRIYFGMESGNDIVRAA